MHSGHGHTQACIKALGFTDQRYSLALQDQHLTLVTDYPDMARHAPLPSMAILD